MENVQANKEPGLADNQAKMHKKREFPASARTWMIVAALSIVTGLMYYEFIKPAIDATAGFNQLEPVSTKSFPVSKVFTVLFLMLGPFKIIGPFVKLTQGADTALSNKTAFQAILFSCLALLFAAFLGGSFLSKYGIPLPILALSGGIILLLVALVNIIQQFKPTPSREEEVVPAPTLKTAISPLAFPTIVTPYGIAALIVFLAISPEQNRLAIGAIVLAIMLLNLIFMLITRYVFQILGILLQILAAVLGIIQVALGLQVINNSLKEILK